MNRKKVLDFLNSVLRPDLFKDNTFNGLQFEGKEDIQRIGFAVDSSLSIFKKAAEWSCDMLVVHHGLIWGAWKKITGIEKKRAEVLMKSGINLYVSHLPLDKHPVLGNNAQLIKKLGARPAGEIGEVGRIGEFRKAVAFDELVRRVGKANGTFVGDSKSLHFYGKPVKKIAVCSGQIGLSFLRDAADRGIFTVLAGEGSGESTFEHPAVETGMNIILAGHYATETHGIMALMKKTASAFGKKVKVVFMDKDERRLS